jgi:type IV secretory pathway component VirB8
LRKAFSFLRVLGSLTISGMDTTPKASSPLMQRRANTAHAPGPIEQAAAQVYFERGSKHALERKAWQWTALASLTICLLLVGAIVLMLPLKTIETIQVGKGPDGRLWAQATDAQKFTVDDDAKASWVNDWVSDLTEINAATWQRGVQRVTSRATGTGIDQLRDYLSKEENQPANLLFKHPGYVREFRRESVNLLQVNVVLIRFSLTSRPAAGAPKLTKSYAMTVNLGSVKPKSREDVIANPAGLVVQNFSISEESAK